MAILVTGSTGSIGSQVLAHLAGKGAEAHALVRAPEKAQLPEFVHNWSTPEAMTLAPLLMSSALMQPVD